MRVNKMNGFRGEFKSSFLSCKKDMETIIRKLFVDSRPYSDELKRLLLINTKDCLLDKTNPVYKEKIEKTSIADLHEQGYIKITPRVEFKENEEVKSYIHISFDDFTPTSNPEYRDCIIMIDAICPLDYWELGDYSLRPIEMIGYIDGILNKTRLSGIGTLEFVGCSDLILPNDLCGYCLIYRAVHGVDDRLEEDEE